MTIEQDIVSAFFSLSLVINIGTRHVKKITNFKHGIKIWAI
jgi:hypothetical protein